jgi:opacity protein-like surface antigen
MYDRQSSDRRSRLQKLGVLLGALLLMLGTVAPARAQSAASPSENWQFEFTPYLWATGMKGDVQGRNLPKTSVDMSFTDIVDVLDFGIMGAFEARKGRWGFLTDAIYMKVSDSATAIRTGAGPIGATLTATADVTLKETLLSGAVAYRALEGKSPLDVIGGLRYVKIEVEGRIDASLFAQNGSVSRSGNKDWVDPYIGVRVQHPFAERWTLVGYADIGGFGVASDITWQVALGVNYEFSKTVSGKFGYRQLKWDYDKNGFLYDMKDEGVYLGVGIRF